MLLQKDNTLVFRFDAEHVWIEPWGPNALRVRATKTHTMPSENWALIPPTSKSSTAKIEIKDNGATIVNGKIKAVVTKLGKLTVYNAKGEVLLEEYVRNRKDLSDPKTSSIEIEGRELKPIPGGDNYHLTARFESVSTKEKIYGMGQYQQEELDLKGHDLELAHRNSQASVPFALSSLGYGFLWNNPGIGRAVLGKNIMSFEAYSTKALDYWVVAGDTPAEIEEAYANVTGKVPMMPEYGLGFWQCKLRYQTQEELLGVAREYRARKLPIDLIVIDFFHWAKQGDWKFDPTFWPDPGEDAMIKELEELKIELMVSIWPTVDKTCDNYPEMLEKGLLIRMDKGIRTSTDFEADSLYYDATNPEARQFVWEKAKANYFDKGIKVFWLDEAEPEYSAYDFENYRYHLGSNLQIGNLYPRDYAMNFYEGQEAAGQKNIVNLLRCAWAGSQKYGALVWSGDIASSWPSFRCQLAAGLNMGIAGIPWWTTDIGGFHGGNGADPDFRELFVRWFQWGTFCPVMRLHGDREPKQPQLGSGGGSGCEKYKNADWTTSLSGADNEVWSYGEDVYAICKKYMAIREELREYTRGAMKEAHEKGSPVMRTLFYSFPADERCWEVESEYMFGGKYLCCPVLTPGARTLKVYFPKGQDWVTFGGKQKYQGGSTAEVACPLDTMPVFEKL